MILDERLKELIQKVKRGFGVRYDSNGIVTEITVHAKELLVDGKNVSIRPYYKKDVLITINMDEISEIWVSNEGELDEHHLLISVFFGDQK